MATLNTNPPVAGSAEDSAVGDDVALDIKEPRARSRRLDEPAHHLAGEIRKQDLSLVDRVEDGTFTECGGKHLALRLQSFDLLPDQARLILPEVKKPAREERERQHVDREDPAGERPDRPASAAR